MALRKAKKKGGKVLGILLGAPFTEGSLNRFWSKIDDDGGPSSCWPWLAGCDKDGYGKFAYGPQGGQAHVRAHRLVLFLVTGEQGDVAMHSCDVPSCCNPNHLRWGSQKDNRADCASKGRAARGERSANAILTDDIVRRIRVDINHTSARDIAAQLGVSKSCVEFAAQKRNWKHVL